MYITNLNNLLIMGIILLCIIYLLHIIFKIVHKNVYKKTEEYCFEVFVSVEQIYIVLCEEVILLTTLKWYWAVIASVLIFIANINFFKDKSFLKRFFLRKYTVISGKYEKKYTKENWRKKYIENPYDITNEDIKFSWYGYYIYNSKYEYKWIKAQIGSITFLFIPEILDSINIIHIERSTNTIFNEIYDVLIICGLLSVGYYIGYFFGEDSRIRFPNWRRYHFVGFCVFAVIVVLLYIFAKIYMKLF